jgi:MraZ protein
MYSNGKKCIILQKKIKVAGFVGDIRGKVDSKGRVVLPSAFKKKMEGASSKFIVKKDIFDNCLVLYPEDEWQRQVEIIRKKINAYNRQHNLFLRKFFKEAVEVELDSLNRLLIPKSLLESAGISKDVVFIGEVSKIEIWSPDELEKNIISQDEFAKLAEDIFKGVNENE